MDGEHPRVGKGGMASEILDILPRELRFLLELKKHSSCTIRLVNNTDRYVAFKVKTTAPKRYCVKPNIGVILPISARDFTVIMQAHRIAQTEQLRDKFLVQSTIVPDGSTDGDITRDIFTKETGGYIEEAKLKVIVVNLPPSSVLQPIGLNLNQEHAEEMFSVETKVLHKNLPNEIEKTVMESNVPEKSNVDLNGSEYVVKPFGPMILNGEFDRVEIPNGDTIHTEKPTKETKKPENLNPAQVVEDANDSKLKISDLQGKLLEAERLFRVLSQQMDALINERSKLQNEIVFLKRKCQARAQEGFPFLFVLFVAVVGIVFGYRLHY